MSNGHFIFGSHRSLIRHSGSIAVSKVGEFHHSRKVSQPPSKSDTGSASQSAAIVPPKTDIIIAGSLASDLMCDYAPFSHSELDPQPVMGTSNPARFGSSIGGVGHNVAYAAHLAGASVVLSSAVANDPSGRSLLTGLERNGMTTSGITILDTSEASTAQYVAVNDARKDLVLAMSDFSILSCSSLESVEHWTSMIAAHEPEWVVVDGNWSPAIFSRIVSAAKAAGKPVAWEPVSTHKTTRILQQASRIIRPETVWPHHLIDLASPNAVELDTMWATASKSLLFESESWWHIIDQLGLPSAGARDRFLQVTDAHLVDQGVPQRTIQLLPFIPCIITKLGPNGCLLTQLLKHGDARLTDPDYAPYILSRSTYQNTNVGGVYMRLFPSAEVVPEAEVISVNGVGDTMLGVLMAGLVRKKGAHVEDVIPIAQRAAIKTLRSNDSVSRSVRDLSVELDSR